MEGFKSFKYTIKNKYYSAEIEFLTLEDDRAFGEIVEFTETLGNVVEAIILVSENDNPV